MMRVPRFQIYTCIRDTPHGADSATDTCGICIPIPHPNWHVSFCMYNHMTVNSSPTAKIKGIVGVPKSALRRYIPNLARSKFGILWSCNALPSQNGSPLSETNDSVSTACALGIKSRTAPASAPARRAQTSTIHSYTRTDHRGDVEPNQAVLLPSQRCN